MNSKVSYRPDIDGLRAFAIISVVLFHAFPGSIKGGFVGVDVFFVISGYLISSIIFKGCEAGNFSYVDFYIRRIKRIFPALSIVLMSCMLVGWLILLPDESAQLGKHVLSGVGFVSNLVLWRESGYFDTAAALKPLLHLWSLGVEEQYYIVWPILVALIWKRAHNFLLLVIPILVLSFLLNLYWLDARPTASFFLPMARFWELMIGGLLAYLVLHKQHWLERIRARAHGDWFALCGFTLLLLGFFLVDKDAAFPGWWALMPTLGTFLLIYAGRGAWINTHILANRWVVYIGLISYPLYLWHWPVLVFGRIAGINHLFLGQFALLMLAVILAILTYHLIEIPLRKSARSAESVAVRLSVVMCFVALFGAALMFVVKPLYSSKEIQQIVSAAGEWDYPGRMTSFNFKDRQFYQQGNPKAGTVLFVGDSNIEQYYPRVEAQLKKNTESINLVFATSGGCPPIPHVLEHRHPNCIGFVEDVMAYADKPEVKTIVVGAQWLGYLSGMGGYYFSNKQDASLKLGNEGYQLAISSLQEMLAEFVKKGKKVYLVSNIPIGKQLDPKGMIDRSVLNEQFVDIHKGGIAKNALISSFNPIYQDLSKVAVASGVILISPMDFLCDKDSCPAITPNGEPIYKDATHLRPTYVRTHVLYIDKVFD